jgi:hypothetical protein
VTAEIKVTPVGNPFEFPKFSGGQEWKGIFNIRGAAGIVTKFIFIVVAQLQP